MVIRDFIVGELRKQGLGVKDVASRMGKSPSSIQQVVRCWTSTAAIKEEIIRIIGVDPWLKFPLQEYQIEESGSTESTVWTLK